MSMGHLPSFVKRVAGPLRIGALTLKRGTQPHLIDPTRPAGSQFGLRRKITYHKGNRLDICPYKDNFVVESFLRNVCRFTRAQKLYIAYPRYKSFLFGPFREVVGSKSPRTRRYVLTLPNDLFDLRLTGNAREVRCPRCLYSFASQPENLLQVLYFILVQA